MMNRTGTLKVSTPTDREIVMTREFDAPRRMVFDALTKPELLKRWFNGPPGWTLAVCEVDLRVGGAYRWVWRNENGTDMGMGGVFREIAAPERLVATELFDNPWYEGEAVDTTVLVEKAGRTTMTLTVLYASKKVRDAVLETPAESGVEYQYDRLAEMLAAMTIGELR